MIARDLDSVSVVKHDVSEHQGRSDPASGQGGKRPGYRHYSAPSASGNTVLLNAIIYS